MRALRVTLIANAFLEREIDHLKAESSSGFAGGRIRKPAKKGYPLGAGRPTWAVRRRRAGWTGTEAAWLPIGQRQDRDFMPPRMLTGRYRQSSRSAQVMPARIRLEKNAVRLLVRMVARMRAAPVQVEDGRAGDLGACGSGLGGNFFHIANAIVRITPPRLLC